MATVWRTGMKPTDARLTADGGSWTPTEVITAEKRNATTSSNRVRAGVPLTPATMNG
ncbi:hypothetical protein ACQP2C_32445 [Micromonospora zamorensis]|uniref:hypothetical protein n=1 Tax=Micromonospora zamorensis TaxID=709883 RepID=UPI003D9532E8